MVDIEDEKQKCAFCYLDKTEVTTVNDETKQEEKITKKAAADRYKLFLKKLSENKNISEVLSKAKGTPYVKGNA
jgi:hypothetical protein